MSENCLRATKERKNKNFKFIDNILYDVNLKIMVYSKINTKGDGLGCLVTI